MHHEPSTLHKKQPTKQNSKEDIKAPHSITCQHVIQFVEYKLQENPNIANDLIVNVLNNQQLGEHSKIQPKSSSAILQPKYNNFDSKLFI